MERSITSDKRKTARKEAPEAPEAPERPKRKRRWARRAVAGSAVAIAAVGVIYHFYALGAQADEASRAQAALTKTAVENTDRALSETLLVTADALQWAFDTEPSPPPDVNRRRVDELVRRPWVLEAGVLTPEGEILIASNRRHEGRHLTEVAGEIDLDVAESVVQRIGNNVVLVVPLRKHRIVVLYARNLALKELARRAP